MKISGLLSFSKPVYKYLQGMHFLIIKSEWLEIQ